MKEIMQAVLGFFTRHWGLKLVSLLLAVGFWFYAAGKEKVEVSRQIPFQVEVDSAQFSIASRSVNSIYVRLEAPRGLLSLLSAANIGAFHKVTGVAKAGDYSFRVTAEDISVPSEEIRVVAVYPEVVNVRIDETIVKKLPIEPSFSGDPAYGYKILKDRVELDPNAILVKGPKAKLGELNTIKIEPIELVGRTQSFRKLARVVLEPDVRATSETIIDVYIPIREEYGETSFANIGVKPLGSPRTDHVALLETETVNFDLKGPQSELEVLSKAGVFIFVDVSGLDKGVYEIPASFKLPDAVSLKGATPIIRVRVEKIK